MVLSIRAVYKIIHMLVIYILYFSNSEGRVLHSKITILKQFFN